MAFIGLTPESFQKLDDLLSGGIVDPEAIAAAVDAWLDEHPEATTTVQDGSITAIKLAQDVIGLLDNKADIDGYYSQLTAGLAENLIDRGDAVPAEYLYRTAGGTADIEDGIATIDCIKGNTLVWNQMVQAIGTGDWRKASAATSIDISDGVVSVTPTTQYGGVNYRTLTMPAGHTFLLLLYYKIPTSGSYYAYTNKGVYFFACNNAGVDAWQRGSAIATVPSDKEQDNVILTIQDNRASDWDTWSIKNVQLFDLTLMFGVGNEPATVAEFEALFPNAYYPYSEPTLLSVNMEGIETVGFNQWDEEWEMGRFDTTTGVNAASTTQIRSKNLIPVFPSTEYNVQTPNGICLMFLDANKQVITSGIPEVGGGSGNSRCLGGEITAHTFITPANCHYVKWYGQNAYGPTYNHDICINLSWSGYRDGEYEEYWNFQREIPVETYFPDGMRSAGSVADELTPSKAVTRVGVVDLGTLAWKKNSGVDNQFYAALPLPSTQYTGNTTCTKYVASKRGAYDRNVDKSVTLSGTNVWVYDSTYTTAADIQAAMSGVILYYELAEPTEVAIEPPLNLSYKVSDFGTEKVMVDEEADAPQSAPPIIQTAYGINATDTVRRLPTQYISHESFQQFVAALQSAVGIIVTETWDENDGRYEYTVTQTGA